MAVVWIKVLCVTYVHFLVTCIVVVYHRLCMIVVYMAGVVWQSYVR